jgi:cyanate permease
MSVIGPSRQLRRMQWVAFVPVTAAIALNYQNFAGFLGGTLSPVLTGFIVDETGSFVVALAIGAIITVIGAAVFQFMMTTVTDESDLAKYAHAPA